MYGVFVFLLLLFAIVLLIADRPTGRKFGIIGAIVGALIGSSVGIAAGGGASSGTFLFALIFFVGGSIMGNNYEKNKSRK